VFNVMVGISLVLCLASVVFWMRSESNLDGVAYINNSLEWHPRNPPSWANGGWDDEWSVSSKGGLISFKHYRCVFGYFSGALDTSGWHVLDEPINTKYPPLLFYVFDTPVENRLKLLGISYTSGANGGNSSWDGWDYRWTFTLPYWLLTLIFSLQPIRSAVVGCRSWLRSKRDVAFCRKCGYDLRATPDRCPECGHVPIRAVEKAT
jgi:hypothetical protein